MQDFLADVIEVANVLLGNPARAMEWWAVVILASFALGFVLAKFGHAIGIPNTGTVYSVVTGVVGVGVTLAAISAARIYVPLDEPIMQKLLLPVGAGIVAGVVVIAPMICIMQKASYVSALLTWLCGAAAAAAVIVVLNIGFEAFSETSGDTGRVISHREEVENFPAK
jgi:hypothetical protein